jgi:hypothetical protein
MFALFLQYDNFCQHKSATGITSLPPSVVLSRSLSPLSLYLFLTDPIISSSSPFPNTILAFFLFLSLSSPSLFFSHDISIYFQPKSFLGFQNLPLPSLSFSYQQQRYPLPISLSLSLHSTPLSLPPPLLLG